MLYLASQSPRRRELLQQIGVQFRLLNTTVDETPEAGETAAALVTRLAGLKAESGRRQLADKHYPVLGADTVVSVDNDILGKPADDEEARIMIRRLSGRTHQVLSAIALIGSDKQQLELSISDVTFRHIGDEEIYRYVATGEPRGKAGGYAIQGLAALFVTRLEGSYSGVVGLPLEKLFTLLESVEVPYWIDYA